MIDPQLKAAVKEIDKLRNENSELLNLIVDCRNQIEQLKVTIRTLKEGKSKNIDNLISESKAAMKRYTEKLKKECEGYAKQKQSKRK